MSACDIYNDKIPVQKIEPSAMHVLFFGENEDVIAAEGFITDVSFDENGNRIVDGGSCLHRAVTGCSSMISALKRL